MRQEKSPVVSDNGDEQRLCRKTCCEFDKQQIFVLVDVLFFTVIDLNPQTHIIIIVTTLEIVNGGFSRCLLWSGLVFMAWRFKRMLLLWRCCRYCWGWRILDRRWSGGLSSCTLFCRHCYMKFILDGLLFQLFQI